MKSVAIFYFSGTGNTQIIANKIKDEFIKQEYDVDVFRIDDVLKGNLKINTGKYALIGIGSPVIGFGVPLIVRNFLKALPKENDKQVFIFRTAGGVAPINYNASKPMIRKLTKKGYDVFYERIFSINSNWIVTFDNTVVRQLYEATCKKAEIMCREVISGQKRILKTGFALKIRMEIIAFLSRSFLRFVGKDMKISQSCRHCGLCIKNCPANNICERNEKIKFKLSCNSCLKCVYSCPQNAISFRFLSFFPVKGGYNINKILNQECNSGETPKRPEPAFFKEYIKNNEL